MNNLTSETPKIMPCGHPRVCLVCTDEGTHHCAWCEDIESTLAELEVCRQAVMMWQEQYRESRDEVMRLTADLVRVRMRATVGGASVL
jgi:hypothetical protein